MLPGLKKRVVNFHDVLMYVAIARKHLRLMVLLLCFSWLAGLVYFVYARPVYYSRSLIKVNMVDRQRISAEKEFDERFRVGGIIRDLRAPHIVERTAAKLGVRSDHRSIYKNYVKKIEPRANSENNIELEVWPYSLDWAKRWTETMVSEFLAYRDQKRRDELAERMATYQKDSVQLRQLLDDNFKKLAALRAEQRTEEAKLKYDKFLTMHDEIVNTSKRIDDLGHVRVRLLDPTLDTIAKLSLIESVANTLPVGTTATIPAPNAPPREGEPGQPTETPTIQIITPSIAGGTNSWHELEKQLHLLETQYAELGQTLLPGNAKMQAIEREKEAVELKLQAELRSAIGRLDITYQNLIERQKMLNSKLPEYENVRAEWMRIKQTEQSERQSMVNWDSHLASLEKNIQESLYAIDRDRVNITYHGLLQINDLPVSPSRLNLIIYTTLLGLAMAIGIPFLLEYLDHTLSNLEQVESTFQLRGLGIIPKMDRPDSSTALLDRERGVQGNLLENFRVIRTNLLSMGSLSKPPHVLMVTSAMPKEGKTVVSSNIAISFAQTGARTLLIDTDLRRGRLHRLFGYRKQPGLAGVLMGQHSLDEAIRPTPHENMSIISAGQHLETGTELLGSQKFADMMAELRQRYDRIVIDTPPVLGLSETSILQQYVDGVLFVIWSGHTPIKSVKAAIDMLQANAANFYGFVLNRLDLTTTANYYQYYYYSHDYYYHYSPRALENA